MFRTEVVEIPGAVLFEEMLKQMDLPKPTYKTRAASEGKVQASVLFFPTTSSSKFAYNIIQIGGRAMNTVNDANNDAAKQAINYLEKTHGKILKDYNYEELRKKNEVKDRHIDELSALHMKYRKVIQDKDEQIIKLTKYWDDSMMDVSAMTNKIDMVAQSAYTPAVTPLEKEINSSLYQIQIGTKDIQQLTFEATELLQQVGKYPYEEEFDTNEGDELPTYSLPQSPQDSMMTCPEDNFAHDVDGLCSMDLLHL